MLSDGRPAVRRLLLRHGKAIPPDDGPDFGRVLAPRGQKAAQLIGRYLSEHRLHPDAVLCSTSARTRETLALVEDGLGRTLATTFRGELYNATTDRYLDEIRAQENDAWTLLVVGHNPATEAALARLCRGAGQRLPSFPTCALAVINCAVDDWHSLKEGDGALERFVLPRDLERNAST